MGVIINDELEFKNGVKLTGVYMNINDVKVFKSKAPGGKYNISADVSLWINKEAADSNMIEPFTTEWINVGSETLPSNLHAVIYNEVKRRKKYTNTVDDN
jgi:hypothetical protein